MTERPPNPLKHWRYAIFLGILLVAFYYQAKFLVCLCFMGTIKMYLAFSVDILVGLRTTEAWIRQDRGWAWMLYSVLPFVAIPVIRYLVHENPFDY